MVRRQILAMLALLGLWGAVACQTSVDPGSAQDAAATHAGEVSNDDPVRGGTLNYGLPAETNSWHPGLAQWGAHSLEVARALYDPLFEYAEDGTVRPFLLERAEHNADFTEWTLVVRDGVRFHNGRLLRAADVQRVGALLITSPVVGSAWAINDLTASETPNDRTLVVRSAKPWVTLPQQSASQLGFVPDPDWMESNAPDGWAHPVGTGPFMMERWDLGQRVVLKRNPNYWRKDAHGGSLPYLDGLDFRIIGDDTARFEALRMGEIDALMQTSPSPVTMQLRDAAATGRFQLVSDDRGETAEDFVLFNTLKPPLGDLDVRQALASAINRDGAARELTAGVSPPADGMFEPNSPWYVPTNYPKYDLERSKRLVAAIQARQKKPISFVLKGPDTPEGLRTMQFVQGQWAQAGVNIQIEAVPLSRMLITMVLGSFDALILQHFDYPDPAPNLVFVNPAQAKPLGQPTMTFSRLKDDKLGEAIDKILHSLDPVERKEGVALLQTRLNELVPYAWIVHSRRQVAARKGVVNLVRSTLPDHTPMLPFLQGSHRLDEAWLRPD
jgi:peptide/nickel transport system substrate-binding protein